VRTQADDPAVRARSKRTTDRSIQAISVNTIHNAKGMEAVLFPFKPLVRQHVEHHHPSGRRMNTPPDLAVLLAKANVILLDFDGPVCSVFANHPAPTIAADLRRILVSQGVRLASDIAEEPDPLEVLRWTGRLGRDSLTRRIDRALTAAELTAVRSAEPTPYADEFIRAAHQAEKRLAIVSNNSAEACRAYLAANRLQGYFTAVIGRAFAEPTRMKPDPDPVLAALTALNGEPDECTLIGDSTSDIVAAHAAGISAIGYANKPGKATRLIAADAMITGIDALVAALVADDRKRAG
jgi:HAD superfamily hydrolase (TIGR01509 family)